MKKKKKKKKEKKMSDSEDFDDDNEFEEQCDLEEDSDYDCNFHSNKKSAPIYLDDKEWFDEDLPFLYNQTRTRKVDPAKFIHPSIRSTVHRCKEYPGGIFIDEHGKPQENHPDTGMYKRLKSAPIHEIEEHFTHDEDDEDIEDDEDDEIDDDDDYEEKTLNDDDDDYEEEEDDDDEYEEDDFEDSEDEGTNKKYNEEEEKDPYVVKKKGQKRKLDPNENENENENSASSKKLKSEHNEEDDEDEDEDEYELTEEDQKIIRIPKPSDHLTDLKQDMASHEKMEQGRKNMADRIHRGRKLMSTIENYSEVWKKLNHKKGKHQKASHEKIKMVCYPNFYIREGEEPSCPISLVVVSKNKSNKIKIPALMDCTTFHLCCHHSKNDQTCTFKTLRVDELYKHVQKHLA
jgi:hypothetical protein